jgi:hypothetical protein
MLRLTQRCTAVRRCQCNGSFRRYLANPSLRHSGQSDRYGQDCDQRSDTTENSNVASVFAGHRRPPVPPNQGPWVQLRTLICIRVPNPLRRIAQLSGEAASMSLRELTVNENPKSTNMTSRSKTRVRFRNGSANEGCNCGKKGSYADPIWLISEADPVKIRKADTMPDTKPCFATGMFPQHCRPSCHASRTVHRTP